MSDLTFQFKVAMLREGLTVRKLARNLGYSANAVSLAINQPESYDPRGFNVRRQVERALFRKPKSKNGMHK